jgi:GDP-L-fucose synthase
MNLNDKIYIAGHAGLAGSSILRLLKKRGFKNLLFRTHRELDLTIQSKVEKFFSQEKPDYVFLAAAKVGGIQANNNYPADFIYKNMMIQANVINAAYENSVKRLLFLGSTCIYPKNIAQPMGEDSLLTNVLEPTNEPYAIVKIAGIKLCESFNRQHGTDFRSIMPTNLYGINDNFHDENSHVIPALIHRFHKAKINGESEVVVWGTGKVMREFLYVDDMAVASLFIIEFDKKLYDTFITPTLSHINVGTGKEISINELAKTIKEIVGYKGKLVFDKTKPDGPLRKLVDISLIKKLGWSHKVNLKKGLSNTYQWYVNNLGKNARIY